MASREAWEWDDEAKAVIYFVYEFWVREHRPPNSADLCLATGFDRRKVKGLLRQLQEGFAVKFFDDRVALVIDKAPPFSATPTSVLCYIGDEFISYVGCAMEACTIGMLPLFDDTVLTIKSHCACCFEPLEVTVLGNELQSSDHAPPPVISAIRSPWDWEHGVAPDIVCDSFHYALDAAHARRFEQQIMRRGVVMDFASVEKISKFAGAGRMRDPHWKAIRQVAPTMIDGFEAAGVDVSAWR
jgi:hypothetical protein